MIKIATYEGKGWVFGCGARPDENLRLVGVYTSYNWAVR
jgi:hypothetical protein